MTQKNKSIRERTHLIKNFKTLGVVASIISGMYFFTYRGVKDFEYRNRVGNPEYDNVLVEQASGLLNFDNLLKKHVTRYGNQSNNNFDLVYDSNKLLYNTLVEGYQKALSGVLKAEFGQLPSKGSFHDLVNITFKEDFLDKHSTKEGIEAIIDSFDSSKVLRISDLAKRAYNEAVLSFSESEQKYLSAQILDYVNSNKSDLELRNERLSYFNK
jgi:hypothetical protein